MLFIIIFILIKPNEAQTIEKIFRSSNVELIPNIVILNSTSIANFLCINHQSDDLPLITNLSKNISKHQLKIFRYRLNKTTIHIRLQLKNYVGIFHLFCYLKNKKTQGIRADVIAITESGEIKLVDRCQVYDKQYIKCIFQASAIARAIQNDFPPDFQFRENTDLQAYNIHYQFLKNESTNEYLVFKWIPTVDGEFPNGILMNMSIKLPYFNRLFYRFDMTPIFLIKPNFTFTKISKNKIRIDLTPIPPSVNCEKSITPKTNSNIILTWTMIKSTQNIIIINNILYNTIYEICTRCRQTSNDLYAIKKCQEMRTSNKFCEILGCNFRIIAIVIISCLILFIIIGLIYRFCRNEQVRDSAQSAPGEPVVDNPINDTEQGKYSYIDPEDLTGPESQTLKEYIPLFQQ